MPFGFFPPRCVWLAIQVHCNLQGLLPQQGSDTRKTMLGTPLPIALKAYCHSCLQSAGILAASIGLLLSCNGPVWCDESLVAKAIIPNDQQQNEARELTRSMFAEEYVSAKSSQEKRALAERMLAAVETNDHLAAKYAILGSVCNVAGDVGDVQLAETAITELDRLFEIDVLELRRSLYQKLHGSVGDTASRERLVASSMLLIDDLTASDRLDEALGICDLTKSTAQLMRDSDIVKELTERQAHLVALKQKFPAAAMKTLLTDPIEPESNLAVGKYRCFAKDEWNDGLKMLALGSDIPLKRLARLDLAENTEKALYIADTWWSIAESLQTDEAQRIKAHAALWYIQALDSLTDVQRLPVEKRIDEADIEKKDLLSPRQEKTPKSITNSIGMKLNLIPAGSFMMGSPTREPERRDDETQHPVKISKPFYLGTTEVTQGQWQAVMGTTPWKGQRFVQEGTNFAATHVSWEDAVEFCMKLSEQEGRNYSLPTEAQWEYACRGGSKAAYCFGDEPVRLKNYAWFYENARLVDEEYVHEVGRKRPNSFGLYDMHGNVWEHCFDWYTDYPTGSENDPQGPSTGSYRVYRGGSWFHDAVFCRSATRKSFRPTFRDFQCGLRVALVP